MRSEPERPIYLASASPRRRELLQQLGIDPQVRAADVDESVHPGERPQAYVRRLAIAKAAEVSAALGESSGCLVIGSDTAVVVAGRILGKPADAQAAQAMLMTLAGRTHQVLTGVALLVDGAVHYRLSDSRVSFRLIDAEEAAAYWASGEPADKAGGYAIQGIGAVFVNALNGSYSGVMGLPLFETAELLAAAGVQLLKNYKD